VKLAIVVSKGPDNEVGRICSNSKISDILEFLRLFGVEDWKFDTKGRVQVYSNKSDLYVAIGPVDRHDYMRFQQEIGQELQVN
jgi:hypothetical protein